MFKHQGIWLPDGEKHFPEWMTKNGEMVDGKGTYQIKKLRAALAFCSGFRVAVDVGAHVGLWSMHLVKRFGKVHSFEPVDTFRECFQRNLQDVVPQGHHVDLLTCALGAAPGVVEMKIPRMGDGLDTGGTHVGEVDQALRTLGGVGTVEMRTLDSFDLCDVDFVKIDCEGYEHHVIEGAEDTIRRCKPTIIVEQKQHKLGPNFGIKGRPAVDLLKSWDYGIRAEISGDFIMAYR